MKSAWFILFTISLICGAVVRFDIPKPKAIIPSYNTNLQAPIYVTPNNVTTIDINQPEPACQNVNSNEVQVIVNPCPLASTPRNQSTAKPGPVTYYPATNGNSYRLVQPNTHKPYIFSPLSLTPVTPTFTYSLPSLATTPALNSYTSTTTYTSAEAADLAQHNCAQYGNSSAYQPCVSAYLREFGY
jgi:hypothetical protein